ncbi:unnamed protein product [Meloidogyne enterolobii]|uniref:Uncharacterized protein n=1 Tax=Meloidogyne enterolobii TaxID=390850 RepID=A0ACB0XNZ7_MELEN
MDSFYVILPSNTEDVDGNTTSKFTVRMPDTLELDSTWTVALSNIIYPFSFSLLDDSETNETESITVFRTYKDEVRSTRIEIPDLFFSSEAALESALNSFLLDVWEKELEKIRLEEENEEAKKRIYGGFFRRRRDADNTEVTEYGYPPEYQKKLLDLNKIQLSDPRYQWVSVHHDLTHNRFWFWFQVYARHFWRSSPTISICTKIS